VLESSSSLDDEERQVEPLTVTVLGAEQAEDFGSQTCLPHLYTHETVRPLEHLTLTDLSEGALISIHQSPTSTYETPAQLDPVELETGCGLDFGLGTGCGLDFGLGTGCGLDFGLGTGCGLGTGLGAGAGVTGAGVTGDVEELIEVSWTPFPPFIGLVDIEDIVSTTEFPLRPVILTVRGRDSGYG